MLIEEAHPIAKENNMPRTISSATINKFTVWGVVLVLLFVAATALSIMLGDLGVFGSVALPIGVLGAMMFYRNKLDQRKSR